MDLNAPDVEDLNIRAEEVKLMANRQLKLEESIKKGNPTVYDQCSHQEVSDKLKDTYNGERTQKKQSIHELIQKIEQICMGFDNHKQKVFNLVQALKMLFLHTQSKKEMVKDYGRNFRSLWDTVEAFGGSPRIHKGIVDESKRCEQHHCGLPEAI